MSKGKVLLGLLAGVAAGAMLGILFAPDKGSATRKKIVRKGEDYADELKDKFNDIVEDISEKIHTIKKEGEELLQKSKAKAAHIKDDIENAII